MTGKTVLPFLMLAALLLSSCFTVRYTATPEVNGPHHEEWVNFFLWGLIGEKKVDLDEVCPQGAARWQNQATFVNGLLYFITIGIYAPRTITVDCTGSKAAGSPGSGKTNVATHKRVAALGGEG